MNPTLKDVRAAYGSAWSIIGILVSAAAVFNFIERTLKISLSEVFRALLNAIRNLLHPIIELLLGWLPFHLSETMKDGILLWFVIGGATARTFYRLVERLSEMDDTTIGGGPLDRLTNLSAAKILGIPFALALWPLALWLFWLAPIVYRSDPFINPDGRRPGRPWKKRLRTAAASDSPALIASKRYDHDLRFTFMLQLLGIAGAVMVLSFLNAAGVK